MPCWRSSSSLSDPNSTKIFPLSPLHHQQHRRSLSTTTSTGATATGGPRGQRIAGLHRFYQQVDIAVVPDPFSSKNNNTVASPVAPGVDGSRSATGVHHPPTATTIIRSRNKNENENDDSDNDDAHQQAWIQNLTPRPVHTPLVDIQKSSPPKDQQQTWYGVTLDGKLIQTPMGKTLVVPSPLLAAAIAAEWEAVETTINTTQMPLMRLACTTLDQTAHYMSHTQDQILSYVPTDTINFAADPAVEHDRALAHRQTEAWTALYERITTVTGVALAPAVGTTEGVLLGSARPTVSPTLATYTQAFVHHLDAWHLTALAQLTTEGKSFWLAWGLLTTAVHNTEKDETTTKKDKHNSANQFLWSNVNDAVAALRVEEEVQIDTWGLVEGGHDYDRLNASVTVRAALLLRETLALGGRLPSLE